MSYHANLPPGCSTTDLPGWGPRRSSGDEYTCSQCFEELDAIDDRPTVLNAELVCPSCRRMCEGCGEWLSDESIEVSGPIVRFRDWLSQGKLVSQHAECAAETFMGYLDQHYSYDHTTRGEIAALVEPHYAAALVWVAYPDAVCVKRNGWFYVLKSPVLDFHQANIIGYGRTDEGNAWIGAAKNLKAVAA